VWSVVGDALRSETLKDAFRHKLAPALERRFGKGFATVGMYPIPILTRDIPGYLITPHTDTHWKGITVQFYLPRDDANTDIGTIFHERLPDGSMPKKVQMKFARNSGYAFAVHDRVKTRDSILLTYFVDQGVAKKVRNRAKRTGNFLLNEVRNRF
jgi:alpha-ketoglutarate-dependent taurine dioxygenase